MTTVNISDLCMESTSLACSLMAGVIEFTKPTDSFEFEYSVSFFDFDGSATRSNFSEDTSATPFVVGFQDKNGDVCGLKKEFLEIDESIFDKVEKIYSEDGTNHLYTHYKIDQRKLFKTISDKIYEKSGERFERCRVALPQNTVIMAFL